MTKITITISQAHKALYRDALRTIYQTPLAPLHQLFYRAANDVAVLGQYRCDVEHSLEDGCPSCSATAIRVGAYPLYAVDEAQGYTAVTVRFGKAEAEAIQGRLGRLFEPDMLDAPPLDDLAQRASYLLIGSLHGVVAGVRASDWWSPTGIALWAQERQKALKWQAGGEENNEDDDDLLAAFEGRAE